MNNSKFSSSIVLHLSIISALFLVTSGFYFISFPTAKELIGPVIEKGIEVIDIPTTKQRDTPIKPSKPTYDIGDIELLRDDIKDVIEFDSEQKEIESTLIAPEHDEEIYDVPAILSSPPELIYSEPILYPRLAVINQIEGTVYVQFVLNKKGIPEEVTIQKSSHILLNEAALDAVKRYKFKPGYHLLLPVKVRMIIPVKFNLK